MLDPSHYFYNIYAICDTLETIAEKELSGLELSDRECRFFDDVVFEGSAGSGGAFPYGWYPKLVYGEQELFDENLVVADYHTVPGDCVGNPLGWVAHAGTGRPDMMIAVAKLANGQSCAFMGPVASYHEYKTSNFLRLTDSEWMQSYLDESLRPEWVYGYLVDSTGHKKESRLKLFSNMEALNIALQTGIVSSSQASAGGNVPDVSISPNPLTQSAMITMRISEEMRNKDTRLTIYNVEGKQVKILVDGPLPPGNYKTRWDRTNEAGNPVSPGMYILRLDQGKYSQSAKLLVAD